MTSSTDTFQQKYAELNSAQKMAVDTIDGPVLVVAGPGSGKTQILSMRVANILRATDTLPSAILCLTFTDAAAVNMRERLRKIIGSESHHIAVHTFHSFCTEVMNQYPEFFFEGIQYQPADPLTKLSILQKVLETMPLTNPLRQYNSEHGWTYLGNIEDRIGELKKAGFTPETYRALIQENNRFLKSVDGKVSSFFEQFKDARAAAPHARELLEILESFDDSEDSEHEPMLFQPKKLQQLLVQSLAEAIDEIEESTKKDSKPFTQWKNKFTKVDSFKHLRLKDAMNAPKFEALTEIYEAFLQAMHKEKLFDFDDMLIQVTQALEQFPELRYNLQERYLYFLVDEFQDTSGSQSKLLDLIVDSEISNGQPNIMAVGDDDQAIYKFQGASISNILNFTEKYPTAVIVNMVQNYRSVQPVLDYAMGVIDEVGERLTQIPGVSKKLVSEVKK